MGMKSNITISKLIMIKKLITFFTEGNKRSVEAKKNVLGSLVIKILSIAISLVMVPITIHYINPTQYGIWLTLSSMVAWISFFDIGFTQGLRNRFTEARAAGNTDLARTYVSTAYFYIGIIFFCIWILLMIINRFIDWGKVLNIDQKTAQEVIIMAYIIISYFCFQFIFKIINTILIADQKPAQAVLLDLLGQFFSLIAIFILTKVTAGSLINLTLALGIAPTLVVIIGNIYFFKTKYKAFIPSLQYVKNKYAKDIMTLGVKFFVLQIAAIVQYQTILFLIAHYFDPLQVTSYNIAYKYFGILQMGFLILVTPLWSSVTDAYSSGDIDWIRNAVKKYLLVLIPFILLGAVMLTVATPIYNLWLGENVVKVPFTISLLCYIFISTTLFAYIFVFVINGIGALQIQFYSSIITAVGFVILSMILIKSFHLGVESILISSIISNLFGFVIAPIQYYQIIVKRRQQGIWVK
ncbi:MAG: lipopolysaccharide biosynthesis protein [Deltaproteobacteria bacterium]